MSLLTKEQEEEFEKQFCDYDIDKIEDFPYASPEKILGWLREQDSVQPEVMQKIAKRLSEEQREKKLMSENLVLLDLGKAERLKGYLAGIERAIHIMIDVDSNFSA